MRDGLIARGRTHQKRSFGQKLAAAGQQHNVAQKFHAARFAAVLVVDFGVHVIRRRRVESGARRIRTRDPTTARCEALRDRLAAELGLRKRQDHELPRVQPKMLRQKNRIEIAAKRHQLRFDSLQARRSTQSAEHFRDQLLRDWRLLEIATKRISPPISPL